LLYIFHFGPQLIMGHHTGALGRKGADSMARDRSMMRLITVSAPA
jgi:hypothetical protein